jgi:ABC-type bacteriocin/lantibiotic exporter with double-glycine peptidase domain
MWTRLVLFWRFAKMTLPFWDKILLSFVVGNCIELGMLLPPLVLRVLFDYVYPYKDFDLLIVFALIPLFLTVVLNGLSILRSFTDLYVNQQVFEDLYAKFYSKIQRLPIRFFHDHPTGDLMYRMTDDLQVIEVTVLSTIPNLLSALFKLSVLLFICFTMNGSLTILALIGVPFYFAHTHVFSKKLQEINHENKEMNARLFDLLEERLSNIKLIKLLHSWSTEVDQLLSHVSRMFLVERKEKLTHSSYTIVGTVFSRFWAMILGLYTGYCIITGKLTIGEVVAITSYIAMLQNPFTTISSLYSQFMISSVSFQRVTEILDFQAESEEHEKGNDITISGDIRFESVSFSYDVERMILHDMTFSVEAGHSLAIVGRTGIGKSSIVDLLLRFYSPQYGRILIDGVDISSVTLRSLREQISLISQNTCLFYGSIRDNIAFGMDGDVSDEAIIEAAKQADAHEFIMTLPGQYLFQVGTKGEYLSHGERQKIAIARALLKKPKIIIFDEATAALDGESEKQLQKTITKLKGHATVIVIAHRLSTIKAVDQILVIGNEGNVAETGHLVDLMEKKGLFYKLYELQIGGFEQFLQQVHFLLKSLKRYDRPFSVAVADIVGFKVLAQRVDEKQLDHFIDDCGLTISLFLREVDYACYQSNGRFWIALPETPEEGASQACMRLEKHLREVKFPHLSLEGIHIRWSVRQSSKEDEVEVIVDQLEAQMKDQGAQA